MGHPDLFGAWHGKNAGAPDLYRPDRSGTLTGMEDGTCRVGRTSTLALPSVWRVYCSLAPGCHF
jgi:hypothetical protein